jgi:hypothetical protein
MFGERDHLQPKIIAYLRSIGRYVEIWAKALPFAAAGVVYDREATPLHQTGRPECEA